MNKFVTQLRNYAEHNPKASTAILTFATLGSCVAAVVFIDLRDRYAYDESKRINDGMESSSIDDITTRNEAQLSAMVQNAKNSSWQENLRNAADAQERFMLPGRNVDGDSDKVPEYISNISKRSEEIIETKRRENEKEIKNDQSLTRFWK